MTHEEELTALEARLDAEIEALETEMEALRILASIPRLIEGYRLEEVLS